MIHMFVATVDSKGNILKIKDLIASDLVTPYGLAIIDNKVYVSGQYSGNILAGKFRIETIAHREMFTASLNLENDMLWLKNTGIIQENEGKSMFFNARYSSTGEMLDSTIISEQSFDAQMPIVSYDKKTIVFTGRFDALNMKLAKSEIYDKKDAFEYAKTLQSLTEYYVSKKYDKGAAGMFAFIATIDNGKIKVKSKEFMAAMKMINPDFEEMYPKLYKNLRDIKSVKSKNNIVTFNVTKIDHFKIGGIIIEDNARVSIRYFRNGDVQINVLSGVSYKLFIQKSKVNYIRIMKVTGNMLVCYDSDNDQKIIKFRKNILK